MPTGKVKWYDSEKGFGFVSAEGGGDAFVHANALPEGVTVLKPGQRVEFDMAEGKKGAQALHLRLVDPPQSVVRNTRKPAEDMVVVVEDTIRLLDDISNSLRRGKYPEKKAAQRVAQLLRAVATDLDA